MNLERIRQRVTGGGFHPFALRTSDDREYAVRHPEMVLVAPRSLAVVDRDGEIVTDKSLAESKARLILPTVRYAAHHG